MPWGNGIPQYQPVGVCKVKSRSGRLLPADANKEMYALWMISDTNLMNDIQALLAEALQVAAGRGHPRSGFWRPAAVGFDGAHGSDDALEERFGVEINADTIAALISVPAICSIPARRTAMP